MSKKQTAGGSEIRVVLVQQALVSACLQAVRSTRNPCRRLSCLCLGKVRRPRQTQILVSQRHIHTNCKACLHKLSIITDRFQMLFVSVKHHPSSLCGFDWTDQRVVQATAFCFFLLKFHQRKQQTPEK